MEWFVGLSVTLTDSAERFDGFDGLDLNAIYSLYSELLWIRLSENKV